MGDALEFDDAPEIRDDVRIAKSGRRRNDHRRARAERGQARAEAASDTKHREGDQDPVAGIQIDIASIEPIAEETLDIPVAERNNLGRTGLCHRLAAARRSDPGPKRRHCRDRRRARASHHRTRRARREGARRRAPGCALDSCRHRFFCIARRRRRARFRWLLIDFDICRLVRRSISVRNKVFVIRKPPPHPF